MGWVTAAGAGADRGADECDTTNIGSAVGVGTVIDIAFGLTVSLSPPPAAGVGVGVVETAGVN